MNVPLEWSFNPWRERPKAAASATGISFGSCLLIGTLGQPPLLTLVLCAALLASLWPLLAPARCRVDEQGVSRRGPFGLERRPWGDLKRCVSGPAGLLVSPYPRSHWLDGYRSLWLPLPKRDGERLRNELLARLAHHGF
ncbi:MAG TPA: hypothetical protein VGK93_09120 [Candidatus Eisenbacteria bacterium]|jgi:hypothetical protein